MKTDPILIIQHQTFDGPAYLATWLDSHNISYVVVNAELDGEFPESMEHYSALAVMGGAMSVNDPLISNRQAEILILQAFLQDKPVIGHCLGGQLMAKALGGTISRAGQPEIGWHNIEYTDNELIKEWFGDDPTNLVMQWHYETFSIPTGAVPLISSEMCKNQAFVYGKNLAMQFHIEVDAAKVIDWVTCIDTDWDEVQGKYNTVQNKKEILQGSSDYMKRHQKTASNIYTKWLSTTIWAKNINTV